MKSKSLVMLKPDALERNLIQVIEHSFCNAGLEIILRTTIKFEERMIFSLWPQIYGIEYIRKNIDYLVGYELPVWLLEGNNAIMVADSIKKELRKKYCNSTIKTLMHCPDSLEEFERNKLLFIKHETTQ